MYVRAMTKELRDIIIGYEKAILSVCQKWRMAESDQEKILDYIAKIEERSIQLTKEVEMEKNRKEVV